ncbi:MAG: hypothetical protein J0L54_05530 [Chitinophagales bacterium]|nr:hypothetical protein [Chitinophagales bacterium]
MQKKEWTIIFLISAKSNLYYEMIQAINEIYSAGSSDTVNFVIIYDGLEAGKFKEAFAKPSLYYADSEVPFLIAQPVNIYDSADLTDPDDLEKIIDEIKEAYPAKKYGFVYKGHGGRGDVDITNGNTIEEVVLLPKYVVNSNDNEAIDNYLKKRKKPEYNGLFVLQKRSEKVFNNSVLVIYKNNNSRTLTHAGINRFLKKQFDGKKQLAFVFMDCCWAMQIENAYEYKNTTKFYIASADEMPALGLGKGYSTFCRKLTERTQLKYDEIGDLLISIYYTNMYDDYDQEDAPADFKKMGVSLTSLDTSDLHYFTEEFRRFCRILKDNMDELHLVIAEARDKCYDFTYNDESAYGVYNIDLVWFLENLLFFNHTYTKNYELEASVTSLIRIIMLYLRKSFMGANYKDPYPGKRKRVCRGITITFPKRKEGLSDEASHISDARRNSVAFYKTTHWPALLELYFDTIDRYKNSVDSMNPVLKKQVKKNLRRKGFKDITGDINTQHYISLTTQLQDSSENEPRWGRFRKIN